MPRRIVAIVGSRPPPVDSDTLLRVAYLDLLAKVRSLVRWLPLNAIVISGDARGVDEEATATAKHRGMLVIQCPVSPAAWKRGKQIAAIRNQLVVDLADDVYAFLFENSAGTRMTIEMARTAGKLRDVTR